MSQAISFHRCSVKSWLTNDLASSTLAQGLSSSDEALLEMELKLTTVIPSSYVVNSSTKSGLHHISNQSSSVPWSLSSVWTRLLLARSGWISSFSCNYELQCRVELFRLFRICCETLRSLCEAPPLFTVPMPGLQSDSPEFASTVRSLQCTIFFIHKVDSLFMSEAALLRTFVLLNQSPGLLAKQSPPYGTFCHPVTSIR